jgi:site-specific DNA-methyltransferase (adenine-specific)
MNTLLLQGNCFDMLDKLEDESIGSVVSDPPYLINFMNKGWDKEDNIAGSPELYKKLLTKMKPGAYVALFGHSRTHHHIMNALEGAGFELRDTLTWLYGQGFPKSHNIGKAVAATKLTGKSNPKALREARMGEDYEPTGQVDYEKGRMFSTDIESDDYQSPVDSDWEGYGTALKPAVEFIVLAQKPRDGTFANNVLTHGVGGLNIDGCRIYYDEDFSKVKGRVIKKLTNGRSDEDSLNGAEQQEALKKLKTLGRFPANLILDEEAGKILDEQAPNTGGGHKAKTKVVGYGKFGGGSSTYKGAGERYDGMGGASRFFYCPKVHKKERELGCEALEEKTRHRVNAGGLEQDPKFAPVQNKNDHPTLKPVNLMRWLVRLTTPPKETCLDLFMGAGSTGGACALEGRDFIGIEMNEKYFEIATARIEAWKKVAKDEV